MIALRSIAMKKAYALTEGVFPKAIGRSVNCVESRGV